jgi:sirohydrochlorin ferrochelatase
MIDAPIVLVAHGSRDVRSPATMRALARRVGAQWPASVTTAFLDFNPPSVAGTLWGLTGVATPPIVVPALLTRAYHGRVDLPAVLSGVRREMVVTPVLGPSNPGDEPDPLLVTALARRLTEMRAGAGQGGGAGYSAGTGHGAGHAPYDGVALLAAGTSHAEARSTVEAVAAALSAVLNVPCVAGYASASRQSGAKAVERVRELGAMRVAAASYFLAPGRLHDVVAASARSAGVMGVSAPLGAADELVELVLTRAHGVQMP